jgi:hypothetical protein
MPTEELSDSDKEFAKFLERDFNQCFEQMRHYDEQIVKIVQFAFTAYTAVIGASLALYQYGRDKSLDYGLPSTAIIGIGLALGIFFAALVTRNRAYFVFVTRYVNEHRSFFLSTRPLGFENKTRMYADPSQPPFFNWRSSHTFLLAIIAALNALLAAAGIYITAGGKPAWCWLIIASTIVWLGQMIAAVAYLKSRENKSASRAVFGKE